MQASLRFVPLSNVFEVRFPKEKTAYRLPADRLRMIGDGDITAAANKAVQAPDNWVNISYTAQRPKRGPWGMISYGH